MSCMECYGEMVVVLAAFDDSMKEVLALVNKTAYNITLACMNCVAYSLSWQLHTRGCRIKHFAAPRAHTHCLVLWSSGNAQTVGARSGWSANRRPQRCDTWRGGWGVQITPSSWWSSLLLGLVSLCAISRKKVHLLTKRKAEGWSNDSAEAERCRDKNKS